jgi:hypothetical protein
MDLFAGVAIFARYGLQQKVRERFLYSSMYALEHQLFISSYPFQHNASEEPPQPAWFD